MEVARIVQKGFDVGSFGGKRLIFPARTSRLLVGRLDPMDIGRA